MAEKIVVGPVDKGLRTDREPFNIDNDSFPTLLNAYQWRGRIKRKRGTSLLGRLSRFFNSTISSYGSTTTITLDGGGNGNLLTGFSLQSGGNIIPGTVTITDTVSSVVYTDPSMNGTLSPSGSINYATGAITIVAASTHAVSAVFSYYPDLPVMGLEDLNLNANQFPGTLAFDTVYSYNILTTSPYSIYDVSFYKNPPSGTYVGYTAKGTPTRTTWNGQNYQQFWTVNYQGALWATNGINVPFSVTNIGMQFAPSSAITYISNTATTLVVTITGSPLVVGDFVFLNEWTASTPANAATLNLQTGYVTNINAMNGHITITLPNANVASDTFTPGIIQYLTNRSDVTKDCLRWYDGDPTNANASSPTLSGTNGWVNFAPPLSNAVFSIDDQPQLQYYLVGARMIVPFKDYLLFLGPVIQTSTAGSQKYLQDTVIFSQNGTPYYTASFTGSALSAATVFHSILTPANQTASPAAYFEDVTGFGGNLTAGFAQPITTVSYNQDVLIVGFTNRQTLIVFTGDNIIPFNFFVINSELGSGSTFSVINMDRGVITIGDHGIVITRQISAERVDLNIPDQVFQFSLTSNGPQRITAQRDFINEWIYFTYGSNLVPFAFPNQTLQYNYRDGTWAIFNECYTTYGQFRKSTGYTWGTIGQVFATWGDWNEPWGAGSSTLLQPKVIGGNQQGFVLLREDGTNEGTSLYIQGFSGNTVTCPNHCLNNGDFIVISGCIGTIGALVNGNIFQVVNPSSNANTFMLNPSIGSGTYFGGGLIQRMYIPLIQTRQFPVSWAMARKTRIGSQQYLLSRTANGQIQLLIYLSQNEIGQNAGAYNTGPIVPSVDPLNNSLIYSTVLYTCPESTNLGLTPANTNLQMPTAFQQQQIWHRINTSLIGDTVQLGFTLSNDQMTDSTFSNQFAEIELHGFVLDVTPSQLLS